MIKQRKVTIKIATATISVAEMGDILCNSANAQTYTLPAVSLGLWYRFNNISTGIATIISSGTTLATLARNEQSLILNDGTNWYTFASPKEGIQRASTFVYEQIVASSTWTITHNLSKHPSVSVVDSSGALVLGGVSYITANQLVIDFVGMFSGSAYLN